MAKLNKKVFVAMSGGVDSSVAAALLKKQSYEVIGVHMKCFNVDGCGEQDSEDARRASEVLKIPFYVFDFEKEYKKKVVEYMVAGYKKGITPNPDVMCNKEIKFGLFLEKALAMGADYVATGHYVRLARSRNRFSQPAPLALFQAQDLNKDQSYFLWTLIQKQLRHCLFPIGEYKKPEVRRMAKKFGLPNADKKDSQGVCFLGQITLKDFLGDYLPKKKGIVLNTAGKVVGEHDGAHFYTIGQRHLGIKNQESRIKNEKRKPVYIVEKDVEENAILVAEENDPTLFQKEIQLTNVNLITPITNYQLPITVYARVRYRQPLVRATLIFADHNIDLRGKNRRESVSKSALIRVLFEKPQKAVAPGQSAVFYDKKGEMLGGGIIS